MFEFTIGLIIIYKIELIADKDQNNTYVFTNFRINLYQVIYAIMIYLKKILVSEELIYLFKLFIVLYWMKIINNILKK